MFNEKEAHLYNHFGIEFKSVMVADALLNTSLSSFPYREEGIKGNARALTISDIGKKFNVNFFDLYEFGKAEFIGFGIDHLPVELTSKFQFYNRERMFKKWCVFKNSHNIIAVNPFHCDAHPI